MHYSVVFPGGEVKYLFDVAFSSLSELVSKDDCIIITNETIAALYGRLFAPYRTIILPDGEAQKNWQAIEGIAQELYEHEAHRKTMLVGVGGGVITDITGFIASVYMRGIPFGFVPVSLLAMVDASIGGKNGVNMGNQKNFLGAISQPKFLLYDTGFLDTLPAQEWSNGFAEVIKYACLFDKQLFDELAQNNISHYRNNKEDLHELIQRCTDWKNKVVLEDEKEASTRKLLNFGHTAGHAFETLYHISHGYSVSLGMLVACIVSEETQQLDKDLRLRLATLLQQYDLPVAFDFDVEQVMDVLKMDKKRNSDGVDYIVLNAIGKAEVKCLPFDTLREALIKFKDVSNH